ncbi:MAG: aldo/keto reductase [Clostridia bacterium]|jgi:predicted oxidoreductase|nr:aldo/keto reductase [Clostridia bacterium]
MKIGNKSLPEQYIIYGAMGLGGAWEEDTPITEAHIEEAHAALSTALECGISFFDLADIYKAGKSETVFGHYLKENPGMREKIIIQSKVGIRLTGAPFGSRFDFSYSHIIEATDGILKRLNTDYLDILLLHRPDPLMSRDELKRAIDELFNQGKIRALGVSNMDHHQIQLIESYTGRKIVANQLELSLLKTDFVASAVGFNNSVGKNLDFPLGTLEYCMLNDVSLQSWSPLARGIYSKQTIDESTPKTICQTKEILGRIAKNKGTSIDSIVLAWLMKHPSKINPVIGTTKPERIKNAVEAFNVQLTRDEWYELLVASRGQRMP